MSAAVPLCVPCVQWSESLAPVTDRVVDWPVLIVEDEAVAVPLLMARPTSHVMGAGVGVGVGKPTANAASCPPPAPHTKKHSGNSNSNTDQRCFQGRPLAAGGEPPSLDARSKGRGDDLDLRWRNIGNRKGQRKEKS